MPDSETSKAEPKEAPANFDKKILDNSIVGSLVVPIAIVLVGALIVFGVTKMISTDRSYKDLVREMQSKTFGNRWIAAYELSKVISSSQIPESEIPWLAENLNELFLGSSDPRTKEFIVVALGALKSEKGLPSFSLALKSPEKNIRFHAVVSLGRMDKGVKMDWSEVIGFLSGDDPLLKQASILALATHHVAEAEEKIVFLLNDSNTLIRYSAATALIPYKNKAALKTLKEILMLEIEETQQKDPKGLLGLSQKKSLKYGVLDAYTLYNWNKLKTIIVNASQNEKSREILDKINRVLGKY